MKSLSSIPSLTHPFINHLLSVYHCASQGPIRRQKSYQNFEWENFHGKHYYLLRGVKGLLMDIGTVGVGKQALSTRLRRALKKGTNLKAGLLSRMKCRLHGTRDSCGPQDSGGSSCNASRSFPLGSQQNSREALCWGPGPPGLPQEAAHWPLYHRSKKRSTGTPKKSPFFLQCLSSALC